MESEMNKINEIIDDILVNKTFSLETVDKIKSIKDRTVLLEKHNLQLLEDKEKKDEEISRLNSIVEELSDFKRNAIKVENDIIEREKSLYKKEVEASFQKEKATLIKELFDTVFRNTEVRKNIYKQTQVVSNGYTSQLPENESVIEQSV